MTAQHITVEQVCVHTVVTIQHDLPIVQCAKIMHDEQVGSLIITEVRDGLRLPIGILTDRDITIKVVAFALDPHVFTARDIMAQPLVTARMDESLVSVLTRMQLHGVRRVPVVAQTGALLGILEADDIWEIFAEEVDSLERIILNKRTKNINNHPLSRKATQLNPREPKKSVRLERQSGVLPWL
jgi:predicted transcriptional regulator